jgi:hypothetical protein
VGDLRIPKEIAGEIPAGERLRVVVMWDVADPEEGWREVGRRTFEGAYSPDDSVYETVRPIFLPTVPDRNPRTECGCQLLAFCSSFDVAPPGRFSSSRILAALLPSRAPAAFFALLGAFFAGVAFLPDLALFVATGASGGLFRGFRPDSSAGRRRFSLFCIRDHVFSLRGDYRGHDMDHSSAGRKQVDCSRRGTGDGSLDAGNWPDVLRCPQMTGHGSKFGRKKEDAIVALLTHRTGEEAAHAINIATKTLLRWQKEPEFDTAYRAAKRAAFAQAIARLHHLSSAAVFDAR